MNNRQNANAPPSPVVSVHDSVNGRGGIQDSNPEKVVCGSGEYPWLYIHPKLAKVDIAVRSELIYQPRLCFRFLQ